MPPPIPQIITRTIFVPALPVKPRRRWTWLVFGLGIGFAGMFFAAIIGAIFGGAVGFKIAEIFSPWGFASFLIDLFGK